MQKSGSTLAFEIVSGMLQSAGDEQVFIHNDLRAPKDGKTYRNYVEKISSENILALIESVGPDRKIAFKTHAIFPEEIFPLLEDLQAKRDLQIVASYRDPRDICLSLLDAGEKARSLSKEQFSDLRTLNDAAKYTLGRAARFRKWASLRGTLRLNYDTVAYEPQKAIDALEPILGVTCDRAQVMQHAFSDAFTQKNKAKRSRYAEEMIEEQQEQMMEVFGRFIKHACENDDQRWYDKTRANILSKLGGT
jgi:predicted ribosome quality control (RQC) complex YloA/Tae2 family protein